MPMPTVHENYCGRLLREDVSQALRRRVLEIVETFAHLEQINALAMPYLSAWREDDRIIWYEYVSPRFACLLGCGIDQAAETFRRAVIDRRVYRYASMERRIQEEILTREEIGGQAKGLRAESRRTGSVDAVYKTELPGERIAWLKDQASIEYFSKDRICLSTGFLVDVSKEMEQKDLIEKIGYFDELTRLPKRSILFRIFEINMGNLLRGHIQDFVFLMIDVDHFKAVNDTYGHQAGDHVLATLAELMQKTKRKEDEIGRYGGEEFYGFSLGGVERGVQFAERLRKNVESTDFLYQGKKIPVTISIGLAAARQAGNIDDLTADQLIKVADRRLYRAKQAGRNRVVWRREGQEEGDGTV